MQLLLMKTGSLAHRWRSALARISVLHPLHSRFEAVLARDVPRLVRRRLSVLQTSRRFGLLVVPARLLEALGLVPAQYSCLPGFATPAATTVSLRVHSKFNYERLQFN